MIKFVALSAVVIAMFYTGIAQIMLAAMSMIFLRLALI